MATITAMLNELPELATEVFLTWDHPNPAPTKAANTGRATPGSRPPTRLDVWDTLRPDQKGDLALIHGWCIAIDEASDGELAPIPETHPTWVGVCRYLTETLPWWAGHPGLGDDCAAEIRAVHGRLRSHARTPPTQRYKCTRCGDRAHMRDNNSWLSCESGHVIDHRAEIARAMATRPPMTIGQIAAELGVKPDTIKKWIDRRNLQPVTRKGRARLFDIEEVQRQRAGA